MSVTTTAYAVDPALLEKLRADNERFAALFGEDEDASPEWKVETLVFADFEDTHSLLHYAGYPTLHAVLDFDLGNDEAFDYGGYDIRVATPAQTKKIAGELAKVTLEEVRVKGVEAGFRTDRRGTVLTPDDYDEQFTEIEATRDFFAAAAKAGRAVLVAAS